MKFSIIIPAHNESAFIARTIHSALSQDVPRNNFEVIVVDNASDDDTYDIAKQSGADIVVREDKKGTNFARQRGVDESSGEILAFLDADSEAPKNWLSHIERNLKKTGVVATSGPYIQWEKGIKKILNDFFFHFVMSVTPRVVTFIFRTPAGVGMGGNLAIKRTALENIGGFPPLRFYGDDISTIMLLTREVGNVFYDTTLSIKSSPRRYAGFNFFRATFKYIFVYFQMYFSKKYRRKSRYKKGE
jgi:glycosyltransferase involved in cell wall biosynthesis